MKCHPDLQIKKSYHSHPLDKLEQHFVKWNETVHRRTNT